MENKLKPKDAKAKKRHDDEIKLEMEIVELLRQFSKKYDVECINIDIRRNEWYGKHNWNCPMYNLSFAWAFDYLAHDPDE